MQNVYELCLNINKRTEKSFMQHVKFLRLTANNKCLRHNFIVCTLSNYNRFINMYLCLLEKYM